MVQDEEAGIDEEKRKTMGVEEGGRDFGTGKIILHTWPLITAHNSSNFFFKLDFKWHYICSGA